MAYYCIHIAGHDYAFTSALNDVEQVRNSGTLTLRRLVQDLAAQPEVTNIDVVFDERYIVGIEVICDSTVCCVAGKTVTVHCMSVPNLQEMVHPLPHQRQMPYPFVQIAVSSLE